jgi:hypothetical protein
MVGLGTVRTWTLFLPIHASACIVAPDGSAAPGTSAGFDTSCAVVALVSWPMACSSLKAAWEAAMINRLRPSRKAQLV